MRSAKKLTQLGKPAITSLAGVDGFVTVMKGGNTTGAFFRGRVHGFEQDLKSHFLVLFYHLGEARFIDGEPFFPAFFFEFFFPGHNLDDKRWTMDYERNQIIENRIEVSILQNVRWLSAHKHRHRELVPLRNQVGKERSYT